MKARFILYAIALFLTLSVSSVSAQNSGSNCTESDCLGSLGEPPLDITTQTSCVQEGTEDAPIAATSDVRWKQGLSTEVDHTVTGCNIVAHKVQWSNGSWTDWYVVGVNDIDLKYNPSNGTLRRMWAYFYDHNHLYIKCCDSIVSDTKKSLPVGATLLLNNK